jgi:hypothetical protein
VTVGESFTKQIMNLLKMAAAVAVSVWMGTTAQATVIVLGTVDPASPANFDAEFGYVGNLVKMANGVILDDPYSNDGKTFDLLNNPIAILPTPVALGAVDVEDWNEAVNVPAGFQYALGKYGNIDVIWYLGGEAFTLPKNGSATGAGVGGGISHYTLLKATTTNVPDGGATVALMGLGLAGLGLVRRKQS